MALGNPFEGKEIWFAVGSQDLYGEDTLREVAAQSKDIADEFNKSGKIPFPVVLKPTLKDSDSIKNFMIEASADPTGCHQGGLQALACLQAQCGRAFIPAKYIYKFSIHRCLRILRPQSGKLAPFRPFLLLLHSSGREPHPERYTPRVYGNG